MKEPGKNPNCIKLTLNKDDTWHTITTDQRQRKLLSPCDITRYIILFLILLLATTMATYTLWLTTASCNSDDRHDSRQKAGIQLTDEEFRRLMLSIVNGSDDFSELFDDQQDGESGERVSLVGELQLVDENYHVLWSKKLDEEKLRHLNGALEKEAEEDFDTGEDYSGDSPRRPVRSAYATPPSLKLKKYVVSHQMRFVICERFKPVQRGKYLVSPSLHALHACYKYGVRPDEIERGLTRNVGANLRYDLKNLYVACEDAFDAELDELTNELKDDFRRCKWSGALSESQVELIEDRFEILITDDPNDPGNLKASTTTSQPRPVLDPRTFVDCSHVETELFEDYFESPSLEALQRCQKLGVTREELERGIVANPRPDQPRTDVVDLYVSCMDVFAGHVDYITNELKDDYRRCKYLGAISSEVQKAMESKFYEALHEDRGSTTTTPTTATTTTRSTSEKPLTTTTITSSTNSDSVEVDDTTTYAIVTTTRTPSPTTTTTKMTTTTGSEEEVVTTSERPSNADRYAFANCKRIEDKAYLICIKVIKVYSTPIQYI